MQSKRRVATVRPIGIISIKDKKMRSITLSKALRSVTLFSLMILGSLLLPAYFSTAIYAAQQDENVAKLTEGAKKEGKLVWYTSVTMMDADVLLKKFKEKYPFIKTELYRSGVDKLLTKIQVEARNKRYNADVVMLNGIAAELLKKEGILVKYLSPELKYYQDDFKDPEGCWTDVYILLNVIGYNTKLVSKKDVPKTWQDLLDHKWKGKMGMDSKAYEWLYGILSLMGQENGLDYVKKLSTQGITFRTGRTLNCQMLAAGEIHVGIALWNQRIEEMKMQGASLDWVAVEPVITESVRIGLAANASHPAAARLFIDFILSKEAQEIIAGFYRVPGRNDVDAIVPRLKKGLKLMGTGSINLEAYNKYAKLYHDVLMKK